MNIIDNWLEKYGTKDVQNQVEKEINEQTAKSYCKDFKYKFEGMASKSFFIASTVVNSWKSKPKDAWKRQTNKSRTYFLMRTHKDGDVTHEKMIARYMPVHIKHIQKLN